MHDLLSYALPSTELASHCQAMGYEQQRIKRPLVATASLIRKTLSEIVSSLDPSRPLSVQKGQSSRFPSELSLTGNYSRFFLGFQYLGARSKTPTAAKLPALMSPLVCRAHLVLVLKRLKPLLLLVWPSRGREGLIHSSNSACLRRKPAAIRADTVFFHPNT